MADQIDLIPMSQDEKLAAGLLVARLTLNLKAMKADHADEKQAMREKEKDLQDRIHRVALAIRNGKPPGLEDL